MTIIPRDSKTPSFDVPEDDYDARLELALAMTTPRGAIDPEDHSWFKTAVFYEVLVRSFADSDDDGIGDLAGLTSRLDYLQWLGVDCLWLPPFFASPMGDGGYDVADYQAIQPGLGTLDEFGQFIDAAHDRGMRVIIDIVMNHTSTHHPWFKSSRSDPDGPYGDYYVWRDAPDEYSDARIIFLDTEDSNWAWDEVRGQYYWHRFYSHQPDLNYENPRVLTEMLNTLRFWLGFGVDGFRLDAVPYLVEAEGTNCENLPGTHAILKQVRQMIDAEFPGRIMLCEANQWPRDVIEYFGAGDECQMAFHFPVMPRLYMAMERHTRESITTILASTPPVPEGCQWGTFLRNHDELTLEMVTEDDRQYMWRHYAPDPRMKLNLGIRRRLAPLMDGDPDKIRLMHAMLLSLPGSPVLYYGDEIGMGDNIDLPDRDGVRTPMQWTGRRRAGFSKAEPEDFYLPLIADERYDPRHVNVCDQLSDPSSLLFWLRSMLATRRDNPVLGLGDFMDLGGENDAVLSYLRTLSDENGTSRVLCLNNLSPEPQEILLYLPNFADYQTIDLVSARSHEPVGPNHEFRHHLPPWGYAWLALIEP
ncbi:maltose alpha-D-glucosyltransferase [Propionibacterium australiense]|nr:maltose alpha-D-glucosyltransferase [Propionibacterium australiense]RLP11783.1 maltose alpha-D-glucosyltransferase [Propionibacterium australiense]RLP12270.1 maltose alpha-D-glucosyltransferase [Propionibacterium australiense]